MGGDQGKKLDHVGKCLTLGPVDEIQQRASVTLCDWNEGNVRFVQRT